MKFAAILLTSLALLGPSALYSQTIKWDAKSLEPVGVLMSLQKLEGKDVVRVTMDPAIRGADQPTYVKVGGADFHDGTIEVKVLSRLLKDASPSARGFIGLAFRIAG